jgi:prolyl-tRNA synthetase
MRIPAFSASYELMSDFVCGANQGGKHYQGVNWERDLPLPAQIEDLRTVVEGDPSPDGKGTITLARGIEVGHIFQLGIKYSAAMKADIINEAGKNQTMIMGCYGIGIPHRIVVGDRGLDMGTVEYKARTEQDSQEIPSTEIIDFLKARLNR